MKKFKKEFTPTPKIFGVSLQSKRGFIHQNFIKKISNGLLSTLTFTSLHSFLNIFAKNFNISSNEKSKEVNEQGNRKGMLGKVWGFTLIELLVVIAIIGILASIVLVSLGDSRNRGGDASVKTNLNTIRNQAELFYSDNDDSFLPSGGAVFNINTCPSYDPLGSNMFSKDKVMANVITEAVTRGSGQSSCYNSSIYWAVAISLKTDANTSWCIDSGGSSKQIASIPANAINTTTLSCN